MATQYGRIMFFVFTSAIFSLTYTSHANAKIANLHSYCAAHKNAKAGVEEGDEDIPRSAPVSRPATWRCDDGKVLVCSLGASGDACAPASPYDVRRRQAFQQFCSQNPGSDFIPHVLTMGLHAEWRCNGPNPEKTRSSPLDRHGYIKSTWKILP